MLENLFVVCRVEVSLLLVIDSRKFFGEILYFHFSQNFRSVAVIIFGQQTAMLARIHFDQSGGNLRIHPGGFQTVLVFFVGDKFPFQIRFSDGCA